MITQERLKELLVYDPKTGVFTWKIARTGAAKGAVAGSLVPRGYISIMVDSRQYRAHRLAFLYMEGSFPPEHMDHINHIRDDNRWENLRPATAGDNQRNRTLNANNSSGAVGVNWQKLAGKWKAQIVINKKFVSLGYFENLEDAIAARAAADIKYGFHENHGQEKAGTDD